MNINVHKMAKRGGKKKGGGVVGVQSIGLDAEVATALKTYGDAYVRAKDDYRFVDLPGANAEIIAAIIVHKTKAKERATSEMSDQELLDLYNRLTDRKSTEPLSAELMMELRLTIVRYMTLFTRQRQLKANQ